MSRKSQCGTTPSGALADAHLRWAFVRTSLRMNQLRVYSRSAASAIHMDSSGTFSRKFAAS